MLLPRKSDHHTQAARGSHVHKPEGWGRVDANRVQSGICDRPKIPFDLVGRGKLISLFVRLESSVSYSPDPKFLIGNKQKLAVNARALHFCSSEGPRSLRRLWGTEFAFFFVRIPNPFE